jgi:Sec-independent protein secretion pathway component TatC
MTLAAQQKWTYKTLQENRRYFYVAILFICACFTESPHYVSQVLAAVPTLIAFEIIILLMARFKVVIFFNFMD